MAVSYTHLDVYKRQADRRAFIEEAYRHVWISTEGHIEAYTRPVWDGNGFSFVEEEI